MNEAKSVETKVKKPRAPRTKAKLSPLQEAALAEKELAKLDEKIARLSKAVGALEKVKAERADLVAGLSLGAQGLLGK